MVRFPKKYKDRFIMTYAVNKNKNIIITTFLEVFWNLKILCFLKRCIENERHNNCEIPVGIKSNVEYILNKCVCFEFSKKFRVCKAKKNNMKLKDEDIDNKFLMCGGKKNILNKIRNQKYKKKNLKEIIF